MAAYDSPTRTFHRGFLSAPDMQQFRADLMADAIAAAAAAPKPARLQAQWVQGMVVSNGTMHLCYRAPYRGRIYSLDFANAAGSFAVQIAVDGVPVPGLEAVQVGTTPGSAQATGPVALGPGSDVTCIITNAAGTASDAVLSLNLSWT